MEHEFTVLVRSSLRYKALCYDLAVVMSDLDYLGVLLSFDGTLRDVHNVENQWLKQVSDLRGSE